ncbi:hypothetical protein [Candidatus Binatus sp.]|uniref:hypothetical protein n=1 Tax=Candidatus Binatus sp. TaxID=2811406 RepID=UPI003C585CF5
MTATVVHLNGKVDQVVKVLKLLDLVNPGSTSVFTNATAPIPSPVWDAKSVEAFRKDLVAHNHQDVVDAVKSHPGILGTDLVKALKVQDLKALAGKLAAITKLARKHGPKGSLAISSEWVGKDYSYSITPELLPLLM